MTQDIRHQPSGAQNRRLAKERAKALAAAGQFELRLLVRAADVDPLLLTGDLSEDDLTNGDRLSKALADLLPDMVKHYAARLDQLEVERSRALSLYAVILPGSRMALGDAIAADLELAGHYLRDQARELACQCRWFALIAEKLPAGKTVREALTLEQLRTLQNIGRQAEGVRKPPGSD